MKIDANSHVSIDYTLTLDSGELVDRSEPGDPLTFIFGAGQIIPGLEQALEGLEAGTKTAVTVQPEDGYGESNPELIQSIPRDQFPADMPLEPGMDFQATTPHGPINFRVISVSADHVEADFNPPLAGACLHFDVTILEVRAATEEELAALEEEGPSGCGCTQEGSACGQESGGCGSGSCC